MGARVVMVGEGGNSGSSSGGGDSGSGDVGDSGGDDSLYCSIAL